MSLISTAGVTLSAILEQRLKDTLCGTKVLFRRDYQRIAEARSFFGDFADRSLNQENSRRRSARTISVSDLGSLARIDPVGWTAAIRFGELNGRGSGTSRIHMSAVGRYNMLGSRRMAERGRPWSSSRSRALAVSP